MPRGDGTGPFGEGPITGRVAGCGAGRGRGAGGGFGNRNRFYATGVPFSAYTAPVPGSVLPPDEELELLKSESQRLKSVLETIEKRLQQIENA
jgi:hypothetical protein